MTNSSIIRCIIWEVELFSLLLKYIVENMVNSVILD